MEENMTETLPSLLVNESMSLNFSALGINISWSFNENFGPFLAIENCELLENKNFSTENITCLEHAPILTEKAKVRAIVLAVMTVFSLVGNLATIVSISRAKRRCRSTVYTLIYQLSVADLIVTLTCLLAESIWTYTVEWMADNITCKVVKYFQVFSLYLSTFILVLIGLDRFMAVRYPLRHNETRRRCIHGVAFVWVFSAILSIPQIKIFSLKRGPFVEEFYQCVTHGVYSEKWQEQLYTTFSLMFMFVLPLITLLISYASTFITLQKSEKIFRDDTVSLRTAYPEYNRQRLLRKAKMKALKISLVIVLAFVVCWTPYFTMMVIFIFVEPDTEISSDSLEWIFFFGMCNSLVNPLIYGAFHLCKCSKKKSSFNMIIIKRNGPNNRYNNGCRGISKTSSRSTHFMRSFRNTQSTGTLQMDNQLSTSSVNQIYDKELRNCFRKHFSRKNATDDGISPRKKNFLRRYHKRKNHSVLDQKKFLHDQSFQITEQEEHSC